MKVASVAGPAPEQKKKRSGLSRALQWTALGIVLSALSLGGSLFIFSKGRSVELTGDAVLHWQGVTEGTNTFREGSPFEKLLGDHIPAKGISFGALKLQRPAIYQPRTGAPLTAWIKATGPGIDKFQYHLRHGFKVMTANSSGREFELPPEMPYQISPSNEVLFAISLLAFPRDEKYLRLRIVLPLDKPQKHHSAEFSFKNPFLGVRERWTVGSLPITNDIGSYRFVLFSVSSRPAGLIFHTPAKGWYLSECAIWDEESNRSLMSSASYEERRIIVSFDYPLEINRPWKVSALFTRAVPHRTLPSGKFMPEDWLRVRVGTNHLQADLTDREGTVYNCRLDGQEFSVWSVAAPREKPEFTMIRATNGLGEKVEFVGPSWTDNGSQITQMWRTKKPASSVTVELGAAKTVRAEFYVRPMLPAQNEHQSEL
jgi:hypothetical protein